MNFQIISYDELNQKYKHLHNLNELSYIEFYYLHKIYFWFIRFQCLHRGFTQTIIFIQGNRKQKYERTIRNVTPHTPPVDIYDYLLYTNYLAYN